MTRFCTALALAAVVGGCTASEVFEPGTDFVVQNPICLFLCVATLNAADTDTRGEGNTSSTTQTAQTGVGNAQ